MSAAEEKSLGTTFERKILRKIYTFEVLNNFAYLGTSVNTINNVSLQIQRRLTLAV